MILSIVLLILIILVVSILILFSFYVFLPSIHLEKDADNSIIPKNDKIFIIPEDKVFEKNEYKAFVMCNCKKETKLNRIEFNEGHTCFMAKNTYGTGLDCKYACIGLGDCAKVCPQQAIFIQNNTAVISNNCCGCGKCIEVCPQKIIKLIEQNTQKYIVCDNNHEELTSCNKHLVEENISWPDKKDFKIWTYCYKILSRIFK